MAEKIRRKTAGNSQITMAQIAEACGFSRAAVSYVLNRTPKADELQPETVAVIRETAQKLGYRFNDAARAVKTGRARTLAVLTPPLRFESNILVVHGAALAAAEQNYQIRYMPVSSEQQQAENIVADCRERLIGGAICLNLPHPLLLALQRLAKRTELQLAQVGDRFDDIAGFSVVADHTLGARSVIDHLAGLGHRSIGFMVNEAMYSSSVMRMDGFRAAMVAHGLSVHESLVKTVHFDPVSVSRETLALVRRKARPTAIVCDTDPIALSVLHTLQSEGLRVPEDISVTGYVNLPFCEFTQPTLTSVDVSAEALGRQVACGLIARLEKQEIGQEPAPVPRLIVRQSSGPVPS